MKRMIMIVTGFAVLASGAYFSRDLFAQGGGAAPAPQMQGTKVAVVNIGLVFNQYRRALAFKLELEETLKRPKADAKVLMDEMEKYVKEIRETPNMSKTARDQREDLIYKNEQKLKDMNREIQRLLGKKSEDNLVILWKEVNMGIEAVSKHLGFQIVLGYGDPMDKDLLNLFPNVNRKMQAMDAGGAVPLYVHGSVDLSQAVADTLNSWLPKSNVTPTGGKN